MAVNQCCNCKFYETDEYEADGVIYPLTHGICKRFPPKRIDDTTSGFPLVEDNDWCGEHNKKETDVS